MIPIIIYRVSINYKDKKSSIAFLSTKAINEIHWMTKFTIG